MHIVIAIPARLESSRLPKKILMDICGKPMIRRVLDQCAKSSYYDDLFLCTDDFNLMKSVESWGYKCLLTKKDCKSGSERIASVLDKIINKSLLKDTLIVNVQGDQPFIDPIIIDKIIKFCTKTEIIPEVVTPIYKIKGKDIHDPNLVKTLVTNDKSIIYFSRSPLPFIRDKSKDSWSLTYDYWGHVGIYCYRGDILKKWNNLPTSQLEELERLEQLRLIDAGIKVTSFEVEGDFLSVDTKEQLDLARKIYNGD